MLNTRLNPSKHTHTHTHIQRRQVEKHQFSKQIKWTAFSYRDGVFRRQRQQYNYVACYDTLIFHWIHFITPNTRFTNRFQYFIVKCTLRFLFSFLIVKCKQIWILGIYICLKTSLHSFCLTDSANSTGKRQRKKKGKSAPETIRTNSFVIFYNIHGYITCSLSLYANISHTAETPEHTSQKPF